MPTTIDHAGRVVLPKEIRQKAGLVPGAELRFSIEGERIILEVVPMEASIDRKGRLHVIVPDDDVKPLTNDQVDETLRAIRERDE